MSDHKKTWRKKAREYLALAFGGKCTVCNYNKTISALDYHHVKPEHKDKQLSLAMKNGHAWSKIVEEARKCTIVCCRCHREIHAGVTELPKDYARFNEEYSDIIKLKEKEVTSCPCCGTVGKYKRNFCSDVCYSKTFRKFEVSKEELEVLIQNHSYEAIGRMFYVTGNAIKKRCSTLGIKLIPRKKIA